LPVLILLLFGMTFAAFYAFRAAVADWGVFITGVAEGAYDTPATNQARQSVVWMDIRSGLTTGAQLNDRQVQSQIGIVTSHPWLFGLNLAEAHQGGATFRLWQFYWTVHEFGEYRYTANWADQPGARVFVLFAYTSEGQWVLVGELADLYVSHDQIGADLAGDREAAAARHGVMVWDANWLFTTYGFAPYPLQEGWQAMTDPAALQPMGEELNQYVEVP
jgi:hypothetical protein